MEVSSEPSAASSGASGADVVDEQSLLDFFMNMPTDFVMFPPATPPATPPVSSDELASGAGDGETSVSAPCGSAPQLPHSIDREAEDRLKRLKRLDEEDFQDVWERFMESLEAEDRLLEPEHARRV